MEPVGASGDQADFVVERFGASLVDPEADRGEDPVVVSADRLSEPHEWRQSASGEAGGEPVDQDGDVLKREAVLEDSADGFFERVATPDLAAGGFEPLSVAACLSVRFFGAFSSDQRASLKRLASSWSPSWRSSFQ